MLKLTKTSIVSEDYTRIAAPLRLRHWRLLLFLLLLHKHLCLLRCFYCRRFWPFFSLRYCLFLLNELGRLVCVFFWLETELSAILQFSSAQFVFSSHNLTLELIHHLLGSLLVELFKSGRVLCVDHKVIIFVGTCCALVICIIQDVQWNLINFVKGQVRVVRNLVPVQSVFRVVLESLLQKLKALQ